MISITYNMRIYKWTTFKIVSYKPHFCGKKFSCLITTHNVKNKSEYVVNVCVRVVGKFTKYVTKNVLKKFSFKRLFYV